MPSVFFHTFGCKVNQYESESARQKLLKFGYTASDDFSESDVCVINSCSVTEEADKKCRKFVRKILRQNLKTRVLVTGCYATRDPESLRQMSPRIEVFSNRDKDIIPEIVSGCTLSSDESPLLTFFSGHARAFVKVQDGCDAVCTYCIIPRLRPEMKSRPIPEIVAECEGLVRSGFKEIVLTGIRLGSYGLASSGGRVGRFHGNLADLLRSLIAIDERFRLRLSSLEITEVTEEILELAADSDKICRHFHLPLQSGDDSVLRRMGRWYDSAYFKNQIQSILKFLPDAGLTCDVIVGFPGETEENFMNTHRFLETHFHGLHVFPFSDRKGTGAVKLPGHCPPEDIRDRANRLTALDGVLRRRFQDRFSGTRRVALVESDGGGYTDNGIRVPSLPFAKGTLDWVSI